jgi:tRNA dimethylallyltransferase
MTRAIGAACVSASMRVSVWREVARARPPPHGHNLARCRASRRWVRWCAVPTRAEGAGPTGSASDPAEERAADAFTRSESVPNASPPRKSKVLVIAGPTAVGKTRLSLSVAKALGGEVVSADSVQVFRGLDVGSSKLPELQREGIKHHLLDIADPTREVGAGEFVEKAWAAMDDVLRRGKTPVIVGGTGMYLRWLIEGKPNTPPSDPTASATAKATLRRAADEAAARAERETREALHADEDDEDEFDAAALTRVRVAGELAGWRAAMRVLSEAGDPDAATRLAPNDWYRAERALEVVSSTGKPVTAFEAPPDALPENKYDFTCVALSSPRATLYRRIDARVEEMVRDGVLHESASMLLAGIKPGSTPASRAIGYRQTMDFLARRAERLGRDETDGDETDDAFFCSHEKFLAYVLETQRATRAFAKRQFTWFRGEKEGRYFWLDVSLAETHESLTKTVLDLFELGPPPRDLFSVDEDSVETDDAGETKTPETRGWDAEAFNRLASVHDSSRGATDHETAQELKRYAPRQTVFVDPAASRRTRREVDALAEKISGLKKQ